MFRDAAAAAVVVVYDNTPHSWQVSEDPYVSRLPTLDVDGLADRHGLYPSLLPDNAGGGITMNGLPSRTFTILDYMNEVDRLTRRNRAFEVGRWGLFPVSKLCRLIDSSHARPDVGA